MTEAFVNYYPNALTVACGAADATIHVSNAGPLPNGHTFRLLVDDEIMKGTAVSGSTVSVTRGQEGTTATTHEIGAAVVNILTEAAIAQLESDVGGGGGAAYVTYSQDVSAGGTIAYTGPTPVANQIILHGTPGSTVTYVLPSGQAFVTSITNNATSHDVEIGFFGGGGIFVGTSPSLFYYDGNGAVGPFLVPQVQQGQIGDLYVQVATALGPANGVRAIAYANFIDPGILQAIPIYGVVLQQLDASTLGVTTPVVGSGPPGANGASIWYSIPPGGTQGLFNGYLGMSKPGVASVILPELLPTTARNTQYVATGRVCITDTATGPSSALTTNVAIPDNHTTKLRIVAQARVVTVGAGGSEAVGDSYSLEFRVTVKSVGGAGSVVANVTSLTELDADTSMADCTVTVSTPGGAVAQFNYSTGTLIGTGCVVDWQIDVEGVVN